MFNSFAHFHFLRPEWFFALIPALLLLAWLRFEKKSQGDWQHIIPKHLLLHLLHEKQGSSSNAALSLLGILWLLSIIALAGPTWQKVPQPVYEKIEARVYVLDLSYSMYASDLKPNRMVRARLKLIDLLNAKREGLSALVVFSGGAHVVTPLTNDVNTIISLIPALEPNIMPHVGSNAKEGVLKAIELLNNTKVEKGEIILISDEVLLNDRQNINALLENSAYQLSILGVGTVEGAPIKLPNGQFLKDSSGAIVIPKLNENDLKNLADDNKGRYVKLRQDDKDVRYLHSENKLSNNEARESQQNFDLWLEAGHWLLFPIILLAAFSFRKGWLLALFVCFTFFTTPKPVYADISQTNEQAQQESEPSVLENIANKWQALWLTGDQRGIASMKEHNFSAAAKQFSHQEWKAAAHYYNGQFSQAAELFSADEKASKEQQSDSWYNRGNALARAGDLNGAINAYEKSLALNPNNEDAEFNKKLVEDLKNNLPPQEQQQNNDQNQQQQNDDGKSENSEDSQNQSSSNEQGEQQSQQQNESDKQQSDQQNDQQSEQQGEQQNDSQSDNSQKEDEQQSEQKDDTQSDEQSEQASEQEADEQNKQAAEASEQAANDELNEEALSPLDREKQQALEQWLRQVPDDPSGLMRRKFELENMRKKNNSRTNSDNNQQAW